MKLQEKTILVFTGLLIAFLLIISIFFSTLLLASYRALEDQYVVKDLNHAVNTLNDDLFSLSVSASDWGCWDDTYNFVNGDNKQYIQSNLQPSSFDNLNLNLIVITNTKGEVVFRGAYDPGNKVMVPAPSFFTGPLTSDNPLMNMSDPHTVTSGILMLQDNPMLVVSQPIVRSDFSGAPRGVIIMGRYLSPEEILRLEKLTNPGLAFIHINDPALSPDLVARIRKTGGSASGISEPLNADLVGGYALVRDIYGNDVLVLRITEVRDIYNYGKTITLQIILIILAGGLIWGIGGIILMDRAVLKRVSALASQVNTLGKYGGIRDHVEIGGDDELSDLAREINRMLDTIHIFHGQLVTSEARFRELAERLPQIIFEIDLDANLTYLNRFGMEQFGLTETDLKAGLNARQIMIPEDIGRMSSNLKIVAAGMKPPSDTYSLVKKDKSLMRTILISSPIIRDGRLEGFRGSGIDITERVRLEEALAKSEEYLKALFTSVRAGIIVVDAKTHRILDINPAALEMIGTTKDAVINEVCHKLVCPEEAGKCPITDLNQVVDNSECILLTPDGRQIPIIKYAVPVMLHGRLCLLESFIDNSYRKRIERELAESEGKYRALAENSADVIFSLDRSGIFTYISPQVNKYGFLVDEIIGTSFLRFIHPDDVWRVENNLARELEKDAQFHSTFRVHDKWGHVHWLDEKSTLRLDESGKPVGIYGVLRDDSERKLAEERLVEVKNLYMAIFDNTGSATIIIAEDTTILMANEKWSDITGLRIEESIGKSWTCYMHPDDIEMMKRYHFERRKDPAHAPREYSFRLVDSTQNVHYCLASVVMIPGTKNSIAAFVDISEQKRIEHAIDLANKKLNLMNQITRHDILNTITGLLGCVDMAQATRSPEEKEQLLNDIRDLTRTIHRQIAITKEYQEVGVRLPVWQNVNSVITRILPNFENSGLHIIPDLETVEIYADPLLEKVFYNLVDNAIRYGEKITTIRFLHETADDELFIICEDDGAGIPPEDKKRIFDRGVGKNTGMGLFLTREILGITNITITENGIFTQGARFEIRVPRDMFRFV